jgi:hypothetical protein
MKVGSLSPGRQCGAGPNDAVIPAELVVGSETPGSATTSIRVEVRPTNDWYVRNELAGEPQAVWAEVGWPTGPSCLDAHGSGGSLVMKSPKSLGSGQYTSVQIAVILRGFYGPGHPAGNRSALKDLGLCFGAVEPMDATGGFMYNLRGAGFTSARCFPVDPSVPLDVNS